ncbi:uncharacterized protein LOC135605255 [Musa acuminata AAA Group]|uniref:uncharacterized protein LOC135605255 n=1 Tax=Musa acuminata AAA Group TaxID=214697 RepID=UPI0031DC9DC1
MVDDFAQGFGLATFPNPSFVHDFICFALGEGSQVEGICTIRMAKGLIWATTEDLARNRAKVLSLYRQILRSLNSPELPLTHAARLAKKAEVHSIFLFGAEERSLHNIADLIDAANYSLSILKQGRLP